MPIYCYRCPKCDYCWEELAKVDSHPDKCKNCDSEKVNKVLTSGYFRLKGDGWYKPSKS